MQLLPQTGIGCATSSIGIGQPWHSTLLGDGELEALFSWNAQLDHLRQVEIAWVEARTKLNLVPEEVARAVIELIRTTQVDAATLCAGAARDGVVIPAFVNALRSVAPAPLRDFIHTGMASQDVIDASALLTARECNQILRSRLDAVIKAIDALNLVHGTARMSARTRMQRASTIRVADRLGVWRAPLKRQCERLEDLESRLLSFGVGGADGTGCASDELWQASVHMAEKLNLSLGEPRHSQRDLWIEYGSWLATVSGLLGKIGTDVTLMSQQGIDEAAFEGVGSSSSMPHKQNPIAAEMLVVLARHSAALSASLHSCLVHEQERSGAAWTLEWIVLPQLQLCAGVSLNHSVKLLRSITRLGERV